MNIQHKLLLPPGFRGSSGKEQGSRAIGHDLEKSLSPCYTTDVFSSHGAQILKNGDHKKYLSQEGELTKEHKVFLIQESICNKIFLFMPKLIQLGPSPS